MQQVTHRTYLPLVFAQPTTADRFWADRGQLGFGYLSHYAHCDILSPQNRNFAHKKVEASIGLTTVEAWPERNGAPWQEEVCSKGLPRSIRRAAPFLCVEIKRSEALDHFRMNAWVNA